MTPADVVARHPRFKLKQGGKVARGPCPVHGGKDDNAAVFQFQSGGRLGAKCFSRECESADILAALGVSNAPPGFELPSPKMLERWEAMEKYGVTKPPGFENLTPGAAGDTPPIDPPAPAPNLPPLPPVICLEYLEAITDPDDKGRIQYAHPDGRRAWHTRQNAGFSGSSKIIKNPGMSGPGWYTRPFGHSALPSDPIIVAEGEKDCARVASWGWRIYSIPGGAHRAAQANWSPVADQSIAEGRPIIILADHDMSGIGAKAQADVAVALGILDATDVRLMPVDWAPEGQSPPDLGEEAFADLVQRTLELPRPVRPISPLQAVKDKIAAIYGAAKDKKRSKPVKPSWWPKCERKGTIVMHYLNPFLETEICLPDCGDCEYCLAWRYALQVKRIKFYGCTDWRIDKSPAFDTPDGAADWAEKERRKKSNPKLRVRLIYRYERSFYFHCVIGYPRKGNENAQKFIDLMPRDVKTYQGAKQAYRAIFFSGHWEQWREEKKLNWMGEHVIETGVTTPQRETPMHSELLRWFRWGEDFADAAIANKWLETIAHRPLTRECLTMLADAQVDGALTRDHEAYHRLKAETGYRGPARLIYDLADRWAGDAPGGGEYDAVLRRFLWPERDYHLTCRCCHTGVRMVDADWICIACKLA